MRKVKELKKRKLLLISAVREGPLNRQTKIRVLADTTLMRNVKMPTQCSWRTSRLCVTAS